MRRFAPLILIAGLVSAAALPLGAGGQTASPTATSTTTTPAASPVALFERLILADKATAAPIRSGLRAHRLFIDPAGLFADLTGDAKTDAIVSVTTGGAAGTVAVYVFSADGAASLRAVYRSQALYGATVRVRDDALLVRTPVYAAGDELCCPAKLLERTLTWSATAKRLILRMTRSVDVPVPAVGTTPPAGTM